MVHRGSYGQQWRNVEKFKFPVNNDPSALKSCSVSVIAWGDGSSKQGFAGIFKGDHTVYTGSSGFKAHQSSINSSGWAQNGGPNTQQIASLIAASLNPSTSNTPYTFTHGTVLSGTSPWGALNFPLASNVNHNLFRWIWSSSNLRKRTYSVFTTPCNKLVDEDIAIHMPGEHFQCYNVEKGDNLPRETIMIEDQFGRSKAVLGKPVMLCNPSNKVHKRKTYKIRNKERHLVCYNIIKQSHARSHHLKINNQFAPDEVVSGKREMFCVPSSKKHLKPGGRPVPAKPAKYVKGAKKLKRLH